MKMDGETNYESDISESWSLIDMNLNEESLSVAEDCIKLKKGSSSVLKKEKSKTNKTELEDFLRNCKELNKRDISHVSDSESDASSKNHELPKNSKTQLNQNDSALENGLECVEKQDSGDAESIEILDMDSSYPDSEMERLTVSNADHFNFSTYQSDDEESLEGNANSESRSNNSTVIKRRRKRLNKSLEESENSVNSENSLRSSSKSNCRVTSNDRGNENQDLNEKSNKINCHPVYKHCRNNVANTILSLSVGVFFAGVACIAIGHFLGVQNAAQTAIELVETLKKLEVENAALQSHLQHLNKALLNRERNSKSENLLHEAQSKVSSQQTPAQLWKNQETNNAILSDIRSTSNSINLLNQLESFIRKNNKVTDTEYRINFNRFGKTINDQLNKLRLTQESGAKILEGTDKKILKELQTIINRLSSSQKHIENLNEKVIKLKDIVDKIEKNIPDSSVEVESQVFKQKKKIPVTELDLQTMKDNDFGQTFPESIVAYEFPKVESFYKTKRYDKDIGEKEFEIKNSTRTLNNDESLKKEKGKHNRKKCKKEKKKKEEKKLLKDSLKSIKFKDKKSKEKREDKKWKPIGNKIRKNLKDLRNVEKNKQKLSASDNSMFDDNRNEFNGTIFTNKKYSKGEKGTKSKRRSKKVKKWKLKKLLFSNLKKESRKSEFSPVLSAPELFNLTGHWMFKWADGREEIRKHQSLSDWQFERAKARKEQRDDECIENWQFKRALARESNRNDFQWPRGKYSKYAGKEFFHDGFSWI